MLVAILFRTLILSTIIFQLGYSIGNSKDYLKLYCLIVFHVIQLFSVSYYVLRSEFSKR